MVASCTEYVHQKIDDPNRLQKKVSSLVTHRCHQIRTEWLERIDLFVMIVVNERKKAHVPFCDDKDVYEMSSLRDLLINNRFCLCKSTPSRCNNCFKSLI